MARPKQPQICCSALCRKDIQPWEGGVEIMLYARTSGMGKRRTSKSERLFLCPRCAMRTSLGEMPTPNKPVDLAFFKIVLDLVGAQPDVTDATFHQLEDRRKLVLYPPALPPGEILPPTKELKAAG